MASITQRGLAAIHGVTGVLDAAVLVYPLQQRAKGNHAYDEEVVKDTQGFDTAWIATNEHGTFDIGVKFLDRTPTGGTNANAGHPIATAALSGLGQPFIAPYTKVTLSGFALSALNGDFQCISGTDFDMENTKVSDGTFKLRKYADATQNTLANTTPT